MVEYWLFSSKMNLKQTPYSTFDWNFIHSIMLIQVASNERSHPSCPPAFQAPGATGHHPRQTSRTDVGQATPNA